MHTDFNTIQRTGILFMKFLFKTEKIQKIIPTYGMKMYENFVKIFSFAIGSFMNANDKCYQNILNVNKMFV